MERFLFQFILLSPDGEKVDFQECHIHNSLTSAKEALINFDLEKYGSFDTIDGEGTCNEHIRLFKWEGEEAKPTYRDAYLTIIPLNIQSEYCVTRINQIDSVSKFGELDITSLQISKTIYPI